MLQEKNEFSIFSMERITKSFSYEEVMSIEPRKVRKIICSNSLILKRELRDIKLLA